MKTLIAGLMAWGIAGAAQAQDWVPVPHPSRSVVAGIDADSIRNQGGFREADTILVFSSRQDPETGLSYDYLLTRVRYDCANSRAMVLASSGHLISSAYPTYSEPEEGLNTWVEFPPNTVLSQARDVTCLGETLPSIDVTLASEFAQLARQVLANRAVQP